MKKDMSAALPAGAATPAGARPRVYIGPSRPFGLPLVTGAIFAGDPGYALAALKFHLQGDPDFSRLFVEPARLAAARAAIAQKGTPLNIIFERVKKDSRKGDRP